MSGIYAICDLDGVPIYLGQSPSWRDDTICSAVRRHLTSGRSGLVASRKIDLWEVDQRVDRTELEAQLFNFFDGDRQMVNGKMPELPAGPLKAMPSYVDVPILHPSVIAARRDPAIRFPRQVQQFHQLLDYILNTQDKRHLRRALAVHHRRLTHFLEQFLQTGEPPVDDGT